jgi:SWI/SNF-related matrix-associated actin-dependent regulator 1 of chromatin subfamily A
MITGEQTASEKQVSIDKFQEDPEYKVIIANQASGGTGLNLTAASYMVYFSKSFSLAHDLQSEARNYRNGSQIHESITRIDLIAKDTIDELITEALNKKVEIAETILSREFKENI